MKTGEVVAFVDIGMPFANEKIVASGVVVCKTMVALFVINCDATVAVEAMLENVALALVIIDIAIRFGTLEMVLP